MFNFFRRTKSAGKPSSSQDGDPATSDTIPSDGDQNKHKNIGPRNITAVSPASERANTLTRKDVVNLLIPETDYSQQRAPCGPVATLFNKMAGHKRRGKRNNRNHCKHPQKRGNANETKNETHLPNNGNESQHTYMPSYHDSSAISNNLSDDDFGIYETVQVRDFTKEDEGHIFYHLKNRRNSDTNDTNDAFTQDILNVEDSYDEKVLDNDSGIYSSVTVKDCYKPEKLIEDLINLRKEVINGTCVETYENAAVQNENIHESVFETCTHVRDEDSKNITANTRLNENVSVPDESADFVRDLVLAKYARSPTTTHASKRTPHISLVYVSHDPANEINTTDLTKDSTQLPSFCASDQLVSSLIQDDEPHPAPNTDTITRKKILNINNVTEINISDTDSTAFNNDNSIDNNQTYVTENNIHQEASSIIFNIEDLEHTELLEDVTTSAPNNLEKYSQMGVSESKYTDDSRKYSTGNDVSVNIDKPEITVLNEGCLVRDTQKDDPFKSLKQDLTEQLENIYREKILEDDAQENSIKKSNLKPPRSDTEGCSDDERSEGGGKKVTFKKVIHFDDGDTQTDEEKDSSFESFESTSDEESESEEESDVCEEPDNDEMLGGVVVARTEPKNMLEASFSDSHDDESCLPATLEFFDDCEDVKEKTFKSVEEDDEERTRECNSDSGFLDTSVISDSKEITPSEVESDESESESEGTSSADEILEQSEGQKEHNGVEDLKKLVSQETHFASQVSQLSDAAVARAADVDELRSLVSAAAKQIEAKDAEIERLKDELERAYKESELIRQRLRSLEDDLTAARSCSADLADKLNVIDECHQSSLKEEIHRTLRRCTELERRVLDLEQDKVKLEQERDAQTKKAEEVVEMAAAGEARWRRAHEAARTQASERAERVLADCEWKMRELEKRARDADKKVIELTACLEKTEQENKSNPAQVEELSQLRGLNHQQQSSIAALTTQCAAADVTQRALKLEVSKLKDLLEKGKANVEEIEKKHKEELNIQITSHSKALIEQKSRHAREREQCARAETERLRAHAERTRSALAQLRNEHADEKRDADEKLREAQARLESLNDEVRRKQEEYDSCIAEARSKSDWELLQLRHLLDRADIKYATARDDANDKHEKQIEQLNTEWGARLAECSESACNAAETARVTLDRTRASMNAERLDQLHKLKEEHKRDMEKQWEKFMADKEECLSRMKIECHQEGEETRVQGEKDLITEISDLKAEITARGGDLALLEQKAANCSRTLDVTEQELREALEREKKLRCLRSEDSDKFKLAQKNSQEAVDHLTRKCACLRKLFDDMRNRMEMREQISNEAQQAKQREIELLRSEVARLTKAIMHKGATPRTLGARTRADGCDEPENRENSIDKKQTDFLCQAGRVASKPLHMAPRSKGGGQGQHNNNNTSHVDTVDRNRRSKSVDLPAVQVPSRIKQLEGKKTK